MLQLVADSANAPNIVELRSIPLPAILLDKNYTILGINEECANFFADERSLYVHKFIGDFIKCSKTNSKCFLNHQNLCDECIFLKPCNNLLHQQKLRSIISNRLILII